MLVLHISRIQMLKQAMTVCTEGINVARGRSAKRHLRQLILVIVYSPTAFYYMRLNICTYFPNFSDLVKLSPRLGTSQLVVWLDQTDPHVSNSCTVHFAGWITFLALYFSSVVVMQNESNYFTEVIKWGSYLPLLFEWEAKSLSLMRQLNALGLRYPSCHYFFPPTH